VFTVRDAQRDIVEDDIVAAGDIDVVHYQEVGLVHDGWAAPKRRIISEFEVGRFRYRCTYP
jgi:hypothetical protein